MCATGNYLRGGLDRRDAELHTLRARLAEAEDVISKALELTRLMVSVCEGECTPFRPYGKHGPNCLYLDRAAVRHAIDTYGARHLDKPTTGEA